MYDVFAVLVVFEHNWRDERMSKETIDGGLSDVMLKIGWCWVSYVFIITVSSFELGEIYIPGALFGKFNPLVELIPSFPLWKI